jgi:26S proteasome regulatory subunit T4
MDEIDAIGGRRFSEGSSADREIQRTLMELLNQMDGFDHLGQTKLIMATNRPDTLDPALLRPGRLDRKIEIPLPNEQGRMEILKIHALGITKQGEIGESLVSVLSLTLFYLYRLALLRLMRERMAIKCLLLSNFIQNRL